MSKYESNSTSKKQLEQIYNAFYQNEKYLENIVLNQTHQGYLIENNSIDELKKDIEFTKLKKLTDEGKPITEMLEKIKEKEKIKERIKKIFPKEFKNSSEFIKELKNNKKFYIIRNSYMDKIIELNKLKGKETKYIYDKDSIILEFSDIDKLYFINKKNAVIEKSLFQEKNLLDSPLNTSSQISAKTPGNGISNKFKDDIEILIRIFYFNKYLREKNNDSFKDLTKDENRELVYLINNSWMEEYKSYFDYQYLENYLMNQKEYLESIFKNYKTDEAIKKLISNLPGEYTEKINRKNIFDKSKILSYDKLETNRRVSYSINNHIVNPKVHELLTRVGYFTDCYIETAQLYFTHEKNILLFFPNKMEICKDIDEIGFINEKGIFIPNFLLEYTENNISLEILNSFFEKDFLNFCSDTKNDTFEIKVGQNKIIGRCFKLNNIENSNNKENEEGEEIGNNNELTNNNDNNSFKEINNCTYNNHKSINNNLSESSLNNNKGEAGDTSNTTPKKEIKEINPYIELMLNIYLFKDELNNKIKRNLIGTYEEKYYILQKNWMKKLKTVLEYDKFFSYLELEKIKIKDIIDKYKQKNNYNEFISEIMNLISDSYKNEVNAKLKNEENFKELKNVEHYRVELKEKKNVSYYYGGIEIINDKIENLIQNLFNIEYKEKRIFLFGDNKIIMNLDLTSQYSIILGDYIIDYFETSLLLQFNNKEYLDNYLKKFVTKGYDKTLENFTFELQNEIHIKDENSILIGKVYKINELENNITTNQNNDTPGNAQNNINNK